MTQAANLGALGTNAGTTGILPIAGGGTAGTGGAIGFKNRFINGNMVISQRGTTFNNPGSNEYTLDRWHFFVSVSNKINAAQSSVAPPGFINSMLVTSSSAYTIQANDYFQVGQGIEGLNISDLAWGTANAKTITISFWVRSSITGTFACLLINHDATMNYPFNYTISSADTWTYVTQTIPGPTSGTFLTNTSIGTELRFSFGVGSSTATGTAGVWSSNYWAPGSTTSFMGTNGATWYMTGCQFEVGTAATNFDVRSYGTELMLCQRYYYQYAGTAGEGGDASQEWMYPLNRDNTYRRTTIRHPVTMRSIPTVSSLSMRINDATNVTGSTQYLSTASWSATYSPSSTGDYMYLNDYKISAEL